jgi:hypothetical protein
MRVLAAFLLACVLLGGCATTSTNNGTPSSSPALPPAAAIALVPDCRFACYESSAAVDRHGWILVTSGLGDHLVRSVDNGTTFTDLGAMPLPPGASADAEGADSWVATGPDGRIYYVTPFFSNTSPLLSIQVASTSDAGKTWDHNVLIALNGPGHDAVYLTDRPWLGFGANGTVYLSYNNSGSGIWLARSMDGGVTFSPMLPVTGQLGNPGPAAAGPPVGDAKGHVFLPYSGATSGLTGGLSVAISNDHGVTFKAVVVAPICNWFPILARGPDGTLWLAYNDNAGALKVSRSTDDGAKWTPPETIAASGMALSPWPVAQHGTLSLAWFEQAEGKFRLLGAKVQAASRAPVPVEIAGGITGLNGGVNKGVTAATDFAHLALLADGRALAVWGDGGNHNLYARVVSLD